MKKGKHGRTLMIENLERAIASTLKAFESAPTLDLADALLKLQSDYLTHENLPSIITLRDIRKLIANLEREVAALKRTGAQDRPQGHFLNRGVR